MALVTAIALVSLMAVATATAASEEVYLSPTTSSAEYESTVNVEIRVDATSFQSGQIELEYNAGCCEITNFARNTGDFAQGTWDSTTGREWITFGNVVGPLTGDYLIGTLTIRCLQDSACATNLVINNADSKLFDDAGAELTAIDWVDGSFSCEGGVAPTNEVYFNPSTSSAGYDSTADVELRVDATSFQSGQIELEYNAGCCEITNFARNTGDFAQGTWDSTTGREWITFSNVVGPLTGDYLIGTLTIRCLQDSACTTDLVINNADSKLFDDEGAELSSISWTSGAFSCGTSDEAPNPRITVPTDGATISGIETFSAIDQSGEDDIVSCVFTYVGAASGTIGAGVEVGGVWSCDWDLNNAPCGNYHVYALMKDGADQVGEDQITVTVDGDNAKPTVTITYPVSGVVSGTVDVTATAADTDGSVTQVAFYLMPAASLIGTDTNGADGWGVSLDTTTKADGTYQIKAIATDNVGATGDNTGGEFTISNACSCDFCLHLDEGWNFVSVPKRIDGTNDAKTIFNLDPANETCEYYNASAGSWMNPADIDVVPCQGYWVWKVSEETLCIDFLSTGAITPPMQQLYMGWNMIGHIDTSVTPIDDGTIADFGSMADIEGKFTQIWQWTLDDGWERCYPYPPGLNYMTPGQGYWIWMAEDSPMSGTP
ncbi:MAG: Ig-like domain-containing protein [Euryarchaeota archaeon]|nr:Ig-like domain-containing protein [Euryarchaeota archaeon]